MERNKKLLYGLIGGLTLILINIPFSGHSFLGGIFGFILEGILQILALLGLIVLILVSLVFIFDMLKYLIKKS